jgi:hypothetical protein
MYACLFEFSIRWYLVCMVTPYLNPLPLLKDRMATRKGGVNRSR